MEAHDRPILIIDDDSRTRELLGRLIGLWGRRSLGADSLSAGLALLDAAPDCIILDLGLPDGCGETVLREVQKRHIACRVVVCSGETDLDLLERLRGLGADVVLTKPVAPDDLVNACLGANPFPEDAVTERTVAPPPGRNP